jgi:hypothetical protein
MVRIFRSFGKVTPWISANFAQLWYADAVNEATIVGPDARRREIIVAVATAESYLFEWTRDVVLKNDFALNEFFVPGNQDSITDKWKRVPKELHSKSLIANPPNLGGVTWAQFSKLVDYRNGLLHARSSRAVTPGQPDKEKPMPAPEELHDLPAGWAAGTVRDLINEINSAAGTKPLAWLI